MRDEELSWNKGRGVVLKRQPRMEVKTSRKTLSAREVEEMLPAYWPKVQELLRRMEGLVCDAEERSRFKQVFLEVSTKPQFFVDVRKGFHKNIDSTSCKQVKVEYQDKVLLEGFVLALVCLLVRQDWLESYELVDIYDNKVELAWSGVKHAV